MLSISPTTIMIRALVLFTAMPVHECAHGWMADKLGDRTARSSGRLTLNPFAHLDLFGSILLLLVGVGWAKPVPVNPYYFNKVSQKAGIAITALAGPVSNILMALITMILAKLSWMLGLSFLFTVFLTMCSINLGLAVFNLIQSIRWMAPECFLTFCRTRRFVSWKSMSRSFIWYSWQSSCLPTCSTFLCPF